MFRSCLAVFVSVGVVMGVAATGALAAPGFQGEHSTPPDVDARDGRVAPSARQRDLASGLQVTWNRFGTPQTVAPRRGYLATGLSSDNATEDEFREIAGYIARSPVGDAVSRPVPMTTEIVVAS